jgi:hypothetical protein
MKYMVHIITLFLLVMPFAHITITKPEADEKVRFKVCQKIKTLHPHKTTPKEYLALVEEMDANGLSTCVCITHLAKLEEQEGYNAITKEHNITPEQWNTYWQTLQKIENGLKSMESSNPPLIFNPKKPSSEADKKLIKEIVRKRKIRLPLKVDRDPSLIESAIEMENNIFRIDLGYAEKANALYKKAATEHEITHLIERHGFKKGLLTKLFGINTRNKSYNQLVRAFEFTADTVPAACDCCADTARAMELFNNTTKNSRNSISDLIDDEITARNDSWLVKLFPSYEYHPLHPTFAQRWGWSARILGLKKAEEQMLKQRAVQRTVEHLYTTMNPF